MMDGVRLRQRESCVCVVTAPVIFARDGDNQRDAGVCDDVACEFLCEVLMRN